MTAGILLVVLAGVACAATGQVCLKLGAAGAISLPDFVNLLVIVGLGLYGIGTLLWLYALSRIPLILLYPFTALTFVLVYLISIFGLGEQPTRLGLVGAGFVLMGLLLIVMPEKPRDGHAAAAARASD